MSLLTRILNTFRRRRLDRDIDDELAFHIEMRAREHERRGMTSVDARREAVRQVGNRSVLRDRTRDVDVFVRLETAWLDARYAARALLRTPGFALALPVRILVDGRVASERVALRGDGSFVVGVPLRGSMGQDLDIVAEQRHGRASRGYTRRCVLR